MKSWTHGFSIVEYIIYASVSYLVLFFFVSILWKIYHTASVQSACHRSHISLALAKDQMRRDISQAPSDVQKWVVMQPEKTFWQVNSLLTRGYFLQKQRLLRVEGLYDVHHDRWQQKKQSLILSDVTACNFSYTKQKNQVVACSINLQVQNQKDHHGFSEKINIRNHAYGKGDV